MPEDEFDKSFSTLISKLGHPVEEIRLRALENLQAKLNLKLISDVDILQYKYLYIKLLEWFNFPSPPKRDVVLEILLKLSKNESAAYHLHSIGAVNFFNSLRIDLTPELERCVDEILENILSQHFITSPTSNLSRSSSSSCQLLKSTTPTDFGNSSMFQLPLANLSQHQPAELSSYRHERSRSTSQTLTNQSGTRGILKLSVPSMTNLMTTLDDHVLKSPGNQFITVFPTIHLTQSDRTVLSNLENALLSRDDPSNIISHCHFLSNVVLNDFPAELFLQRSFLLKRLLALINENNDDLIKAALVCLKDYAFHLQRRIKILRDPACFCPNVQINTDEIKEHVQDEFNNTLNSARSVSSIHSATSNGYRHPMQWSLKQDEPSTIEQPASLDILDFCYSVLIGTFDLLRRLTIKDCLHVCLQLNNSICQIIDLFVKHNYGVMNAEFYSLLFFRLHSLIKQQLTIGSTFHSRTIYIHALHVFSALLHTIELSDEVVQQFSQEFYELIYYILMDECFHLSYPHIRERLLPIAEQFDKDNFQVYTKSNEVCQSFAAACQILTNDETKSKIWIQCVRWADDALLGLPYHLNFDTIKKFVNVCSKISSNKSNFDTSERNYSIDILMKYLTHELAEIRSAAYCSIAMLVASRLSVEETVKSNKKSRKNPNEVSNFDEIQFVCHLRVLSEICIRGMNDLATKVADHSRLILLHLLQSKLIVDGEFWKNFITTIAGILPQLQCYASKIDPLGQCILNLSSDTEKERESLLTLNQRLQASLRYLFSKDKE